MPTTWFQSTKERASPFCAKTHKTLNFQIVKYDFPKHRPVTELPRLHHVPPGGKCWVWPAEPVLFFPAADGGFSPAGVCCQP